MERTVMITCRFITNNSYVVSIYIAQAHFKQIDLKNHSSTGIARNNNNNYDNLHGTAMRPYRSKSASQTTK